MSCKIEKIHLGSYLNIRVSSITDNMPNAHSAFHFKEYKTSLRTLSDL